MGVADAASPQDAGALDGAVDSGILPDPGVEIGTGRNDFVELTEGDLVEIDRGFQGGGRFGGYHIFHSVRITGLRFQELRLLSLEVETSTGASLGRLDRNPEFFPDTPDAMGRRSVAGLNPPLVDCCLAAGQTVLMRAIAETLDGEIYTDERRVMGSRCPGDTAMPDECP